VRHKSLQCARRLPMMRHRTPETAMTAWTRLFLRLRKRALRCYEIGMLALLVAGAVVAGLPATAAAPSAAGAAAATQCGNTQSNAAVIVR
jgi:hypothetical protein